MRRKPLSQSSRQSRILEGGASGSWGPGRIRNKRPDILKLKNKPKLLTTKSDAKKMIAANKKATRPKKKNVAGRAGVVARKVAKVVVPVVAAGGGAAANQWINQGPAKKKKK